MRPRSGLAFLACAGRGAGAFRTVEFETDEGTAMNVDVSPDGRELVFDLLGDLYTLPIEGGRATPLVTGRSWDVAPRYAPDGRRILFVSDRQGIDALWTVDRRGEHAALVAPADSLRFTAPIWSHDGQEIAAGWGGAFPLPPRPVIVDVADGTFDTLPQVQVSGKVSSLSPDRRYLYATGWHVTRIDRRTAVAEVLTDTTAGVVEYNPIVSRTGAWLGYVRYTPDGRTVLRARRLDGTEDRALLTLPDGDDPTRSDDYEPSRPLFGFTPGDSAIVLAVAGKLWRVPLDGRAPALIPFRAPVAQQIVPSIRPRQRVFDDTVRIRGIRSPALTRDGRRLVFSAVGKLWVEDLRTGRFARLTASEDFESYPALAPDGSAVVYLASADSLQRVRGERPRRSRVMLVRLDAGAGRPRALTAAADDYDPPVWFPAGDRIFTSHPDGGSGRRFLALDTAGAPPVPLPVQLGAGRAGDCTGRGLHFRRERRITPAGPIYFLECPSLPYSGSPLDPTIVSTRLDGTDRQVHRTIRGSIPVLAIAPGGRHAIVGPRLTDGYAYLVSIPGPGAPADTITLEAPAARRVSATPIASASWQDEATALLALGATLARVDTAGRVDSAFHRVRLALPRARPAGTLAIRGARLLTMAGLPGHERVIERGTLVVRDGRITAVGEEARVAIPAGATVLDGTGLTIIPGLIDVHQHAIDYASEVPFRMHPGQLDFLAFGVTAVFNPSSGSDALLEANAELGEIGETGEVPAVRYFYAGPSLTPDMYPIGGEESARQTAAYVDAFGVPVIKEYLQYSRHQRQALVRATAERGMGVTAHTSGLQRTLTLVADGYTAWEHFSVITPLFKDVTTFIAASGINVTANISTSQATSNLYGAQAVMYTETALDLPGDTAKVYRFSRRAARERDEGLSGTNEFVTPRPVLPFERIREARTSKAVTRIIKAGGLVSIGGHDAPGLRTHWEMWLIHRGGAAAMAVLRAGTLNAAAKFGADRSLGSLEAGKLADFLVLYGNPLHDIKNTANLKYVVANGVVYDDESLTQLWPLYQRPPRLGWQTREAYAKLPPARPLSE